MTMQTITKQGRLFLFILFLSSFNKTEIFKQFHQTFISREYVLNKMLPEMKYLATNYEPEIWWSDGDFAMPEYFGSQDFLAWLYNESPKNATVVANDRY